MDDVLKCTEDRRLAYTICIKHTHHLKVPAKPNALALNLMYNLIIALRECS